MSAPTPLAPRRGPVAGLAVLWDSLAPRERLALAILADCPQALTLARAPWCQVNDAARAQLVFGARHLVPLGRLAADAVGG